MKKLLIVTAVFLAHLSYSQNTKDILLNDSLHKEKINKVPMDTIKYNKQEFLTDTIPEKKQDDADPKNPNMNLYKRD